MRAVITHGTLRDKFVDFKATLFTDCDPRSQPFVIQKDLAGSGFTAVAPSEVFRKISQNFSPAGATSPFVAQVIPEDTTSFVPVSGRVSME